MNEPIDLKGRDELEALLPFYLNGTLDGADLARVEAWLADDPAAMAALAEVEAEHDAAILANEAIRVPGDALQRFTRSLDAEAAPARGGGVSFAALWQKIMGAPPAIAWGAAAAMLALVIAQAVTPPGGTEAPFTEAGIERAAEVGPHVLVVFAPAAGMADISALLAGAGAAITGGPKPGGIYEVSLPATTVAGFDRLAAELAASPLVGQVLPGLKPAE
jgi:hypothetical protein